MIPRHLKASGKRRARFLLAVLAGAASTMTLAACGGGGGGSSGIGFNSYVKDIIENKTSDTTEPVDVNGKKFKFDNEDETAFDDLFTNP